MNAVAELARAQGASLEADDDFDHINELWRQRGWTDGLPIVPPTTQRVEQMLQYCDRPWNVPVAKVAPRYGEATPLRLAANAVMAGCRPEYFPLVVLAIEAMCEEPFNLYGIEATTHMCTPLAIFNGPVVRELEINSGHGAFGAGSHSNATIGRAIRLALVNIGGAIPGVGDMATFGSPAKYSYCVAENEAENPWQPLHVERGFPLEASTVTVIGAECPHNINDHESLTAEGILQMVAGTMTSVGLNDVLYVSQPVIAFGPEHAKSVANGGYGKAEVRRYMHEHARVPLSRFSQENADRRFRARFDGLYVNAAPETRVPIVHNADDLIIMVVGGAGKHSAFIPTFGATRSVTRALKLQDGSLAKSIHDFSRC